ncbi:PP2C family protein-serine/threonine phosphatase [Thermodesulfobacteriota bacterium]
MSFDGLKDSNEFLNLLLNNINAAVLVVDKKFHLYQFNDFFLNLFDSSLDTFVEKSFGQITGCINAVVENKPCGETSQCKDCIFRRSLLQTLIEKIPVEKVPLKRIFYIKGEARQKHLEFTTRPIEYQGKKLILVIIYDVSDIEAKNYELKEKQKQIDQDLKAAAGIQQSLLPNVAPKSPKVRIAWKFEPCERIGGDIFNIHSPDNKHIGFYMLDVCGHGVSAALISVTVSQFIQNIRDLLADESGIVPPEKVLKRINKAFPFERFDSYFTIIYMTVDLFDGCLTYSCAGHPPPVLIRSDKTIEILDHHGPIIGLSKGAPFGQARKWLQGGDKIVLYTDGILEIGNSKKELYGRNRFYNTIKEHADGSAQDIVDSIYKSIKTFGKNNRPDDDISILAVEYKG